MGKFKVGDKVRVAKCRIRTCREAGMCHHSDVNKIYTLKKAQSGHWTFVENDNYNWTDDELKLATTKEQKPMEPMARRTFKLLKETPTIKRNAVFQEQCDDGTQPYILLDETFLKDEDHDPTIADRSLVEDQPKWFTEVFKVTPEYMTKDELAQFEAFKKRSKATRKTSKK